MNDNLYKLADLGQSVWFDDVNRDVISSGKLDTLIGEFNVTGGTSNPTIFEKAFSGSNAYEEQFRQLTREASTPEGVQDALAITDVQLAADRVRHVFDRTNGADGYISLEVAPTYANDTERTISETRRLWRALGRPNVMIKIPGTPAGLPAIEVCLSEGINVNITLLFSVESYRQVAEAHVRALEKRVAAGESIDSIASVASFFVSRVDTLADDRLTALAEKAQSPERKQEILALRGKLGVANARLAYQVYLGIIGSDRWQKLVAAGARSQRCLWASTSTKNPAYRDVMYVEALIGPDTVDTMPPQTIEAFRDHGIVARTVDAEVDHARRAIADLEALGIPLASVTDKLLVDGLASFQKSFDGLLERLEQKVVGR